MNQGLAVILALLPFIVWGIIATQRRTKHARVTVQNDAADEVLTQFVVACLDMTSAPEVLRAAAATGARAFQCASPVIFEPGAEEGAWDAWRPALAEGEENTAPEALPENLRAVFGWLRHNPQVVPLAELTGPRFGAMRLPLSELQKAFDMSVLVPLVERGRLMAAIGLSCPRALSSRELGLMDHLRVEATAAVANVRLHREAAHKLTLEREMDLASAVEIALVPAERDGSAQGVSWAGDLHRVGQAGSDFWSVYPMVDGRVLFVIGDVVGGGLAGSMTAAMARSCCDVLCRELPELTAAVLLDTLNRALHRGKRSLHATCFAGIFDMRAGTLEYANAGHPMPYRLSPDGKLGVLGRGGPMLGDAPDTRYKLHNDTAMAGQTFLLYTDGLVELMNASRQGFGEGRLQRHLRGQTSTSPRASVDAIWNAVTEFRAGAPASDDTALVTVLLT